MADISGDYDFAGESGISKPCSCSGGVVNTSRRWMAKYSFSYSNPCAESEKNVGLQAVRTKSRLHITIEFELTAQAGSVTATAFGRQLNSTFGPQQKR